MQEEEYCLPYHCVTLRLSGGDKGRNNNGGFRYTSSLFSVIFKADTTRTFTCFNIVEMAIIHNIKSLSSVNSVAVMDDAISQCTSRVFMNIL